MANDDQLNLASSSDSMNDLLGLTHIKLNRSHRRQLNWLIEKLGRPIIWSGQELKPSSARLVVVVEPPTGPQADLLLNSLQAKSAIVIPFSENPAFDFLKSKLTDFGTIGTSGSDGPHEFWWGGANWKNVVDASDLEDLPLVVSCYPRTGDRDASAKLKQSLGWLGIDCVVRPIDTAKPGVVHGSEKAAYIMDVRKSHGRSVLWVEPDSIFLAPPSILSNVNCDFAVHKWNRCELSCRTMYFGMSNAAENLLQTWKDFGTKYPGVWDGYALDQAWSLVSSQTPLETVWLPRSYHAPAIGRSRKSDPIIVQNIENTLFDLAPEQGFPKALRAARRASRTGAPEAHVVIKSRQVSEGAITVILRDIQTAPARDVAAATEAIVAAFEADSGGFGQLELSLCSWREDEIAVTNVAKTASNGFLALSPFRILGNDLFRVFSNFADQSTGQNIIPMRPGRQANVNQATN